MTLERLDNMPKKEKKDKKMPVAGSSVVELQGRNKVNAAFQRIKNLRKMEKEISNQLPQVYDDYRRELLLFLGISEQSKLEYCAESILKFADSESLDPGMFGFQIEIIIEETKRIVSGESEDVSAEGTAKWNYIRAVEQMRKQQRPSYPSDRVYPYLEKMLEISELETVKNPTMLGKCQNGAYRWIVQELCYSESFWWIVVGNRKS